MKSAFAPTWGTTRSPAPCFCSFLIFAFSKILPRFLPPILHEDFEENQGQLAVVEATKRKYKDTTNYAELFYEELLSPTEWVRLRTAFEKGFEWDEDSRLFGLEDMLAVEKAAEEQMLREEAEAAAARGAGEDGQIGEGGSSGDGDVNLPPDSRLDFGFDDPFAPLGPGVAADLSEIGDLPEMDSFDMDSQQMGMEV